MATMNIVLKLNNLMEKEDGNRKEDLHAKKKHWQQAIKKKLKS